jgi:hypothetical protein
VAVALAIVRLRNLFAVVMLSGIYSLLSPRRRSAPASRRY